MGTTITWTATGTGGTPPLLYQYWRYSVSAGVWSMVRDWSSTNTWSWTPVAGQAGDYRLAVWAKSTGSVNPWDTYREFGLFTITP